MNQELRSEIARLGGDPGDPTWHWFLLSGPHGPSFTWGQTKNQPPGYAGIEHLRRIVAELEEVDAGFRERARAVVRLALESDGPYFLRRAIQVAAVVGGSEELRRITPLAGHPNEKVARDARACIFVLRRASVTQEKGA